MSTHFTCSVINSLINHKLINAQYNAHKCVHNTWANYLPNQFLSLYSQPYEWAKNFIFSNTLIRKMQMSNERKFNFGISISAAEDSK